MTTSKGFQYKKDTRKERKGIKNERRMECITDLKDYNPKIKDKRYHYLEKFGIFVENGRTSQKYKFKLFRKPWIPNFSRVEAQNILIYNGTQIVSPVRDLRTIVGIHILHDIAKALKIPTEKLGDILEPTPRYRKELDHRLTVDEHPSAKLKEFAQKIIGIDYLQLKILRETVLKERIRGLFMTSPMPFCVDGHGPQKENGLVECRCHEDRLTFAQLFDKNGQYHDQNYHLRYGGSEEWDYMLEKTR